MKVNTNAPSHPGLNVDKSGNTEAVSKTNDGKAKESQAAKSSNAGSTVEISEQAKLMKQANEIVARTPEIRTEKVEALKKLIQSGGYGVSAEQIADRLVDAHLETDFGKNNL